MEGEDEEKVAGALTNPSELCNGLAIVTWLWPQARGAHPNCTKYDDFI